MDCPPDRIALAERLADAGGQVIRRHFRTRVAVDDKPDQSPVTVADREAEAAIRALIAAERPGDGIVGEEFGAERADAPWVWVIDPIDGTKSFIVGRPIFGTIIALLHDGWPVLGIIDQPVVGDRWVGAKGRPTLFNGTPARTRDCDGLSRAILATTAPELLEPDLPRFAKLAGHVKSTVYGGDCYSYGLLSAGFLDLVVEANLKLYDWAGLEPVVTGAGGVMTDWEGRPLNRASDGRVVAAGDPRVHAEALAMLNT
ncbi:MAG TPA: histidinol-phosphatase [Azospirillaceae bacterium]|nr:histidinol-phosphatase [Azospirillaceae bacterium]